MRTQPPPSAASDTAGGQTGVGNPLQREDFMVQGCKHTAKLAIAAFMDLNADLMRIVRVHIGHLICSGRTILELNPLAQLNYFLNLDRLPGPHQILFWNLISWMHQTMAQFTVRGQQQNAGGVAIQPTYAKEALATLRQGNQIHYGRTPALVVAGGDGIFGLVQQQVQKFTRCDQATLYRDLVCGADLLPKLAYHLAVDPYQPAGDELIGFPP